MGRPTLFEPTQINGLKLRNRFVRSATWTGLATQEGAVTPRLVDKMVELTDGGVGLIITGHAYVEKRGQAGPWQLGIHNDSLIGPMQELTTAVHAHGGKIAIQLAHAGIHAVPALSGHRPVTVSRHDGLVPYNTHELRTEEIDDVVNAFVTASRRAKTAGFDGVQIHAAHGYLISQFLSPGYNRRTDRYGGALENRACMLVEVIKRVRKTVGSHYPVMVKLNTRDFWSDGLELADSIWVGILLEHAGVDAIEISGGTRQSGKLKSSRPGILSEADEAYFQKEAMAFRDQVSTPLILVGGIRSFGVANRLVSEQTVDYVAMSRPLICEPDLINRWKSGNLEKSRCLSDGHCLNVGLFGGGVRCRKKE